MKKKKRFINLRIGKVLLIKHLNSRFALNKVYGLGATKSTKFFNSLGFGMNVKMSKIPRYYFELLRGLLQKYAVFGERLKLLNSIYRKDLLELRLIKAFRFNEGLPCRGQRTHTNASSLKILKGIKKPRKYKKKIKKA